MMDAIEYIKSLEVFGSVPGLENIRNLLDKLGNPQQRLKFIHVAGTNGKGSTATFIASILQESGFKVGLYTSPGIYSFNERIKVNNQPILIDKVEEITSKIIETNVHVTEFEFSTVMAFIHFVSSECDYVVLEVGLGGRLDATNIIPPPQVAVITPISLDHTRVLGGSVAKIAAEKSGIIKRGCKLAIAGQEHEAEEVILQRAADCGVSDIARAGEARLVSANLERTVFELDGEEFTIKLLGLMQMQNSTLAIKVVKMLDEIKVTREAIERGLMSAYIPCRFEVKSLKPIVIIDGAHNPAGVKTLAENIELYFGDGVGNSFKTQDKVNIKMGMLADKDVEACVSQIAKYACSFNGIEPRNGRAIKASEIEDIARKYCDVVGAPIDEERPTVICGSLYNFEE